MKISFYIFLFLFFLIPQFVFSSDLTIRPEIKIFDGQGKVLSNFYILNDQYRGNIDLSVADIGGDGIDEIIISYGSNNRPNVEVWRSTGSIIYDFLAYQEGFNGGVNISTGDLNGDKKEEIITGAGYLGGPHVKSFGTASNTLSFFSSNTNDRKGVEILAADLGGDGKSEIIVASNLNQVPEVMVFDNGGRKLDLGVRFDLDYRGGINLGKIDIENDGRSEILLAGGFGNKPEVFVLNNNLELINKFTAYNENYLGGINVVSGDINNDGLSEIITSPSFGGGPHIKIFNSLGDIMEEFFAYDEEYYGGVKVATGDINGDGNDEIITIQERIFSEYKYNWYKYIEINLSEQRLYMWQDGRQIGGFKISSGLYYSPTPLGEFNVYLKRPNVLMSGSDYYLPNVPWVLSFSGPFTIHGTYWHNNFGHRMSHGCVNMYTPEAELLYNWADIGTPVYIH